MKNASPRRRGQALRLNEEQVAWLSKAYHDGIPLSDMAIELGHVHIDTVKRMLVLHDIAPHITTKNIALRNQGVAMWSRPCLVCKCTEERPKNQYTCDRCKKKQDTSGPADDSIYF